MKSIVVKSLLIFSFTIILSCSTGIHSIASVKQDDTESFSDMNHDILVYINKYRSSKGLGSLQMLDAASTQALLHSKNMAQRTTGFGHDGFNQRVAVVARTEGRMSAYAENVAYGQMSAKEVVQGWLDSPPHKKNIEGNYTLTGIGVYKDRDGTLFFTQMFFRK